MSSCFTPEQVIEAFIAARPLIAQEILDLSVKHPVWMQDVWKIAPWPEGEGSVFQQLVFRGDRPQIERGFGKWRKQGSAVGCEPQTPPDCAYNWTTFGGHSFDRKLVETMSRDFRTPEYCVKEIQTLANYKEVMAQIIQNIFAQTSYFKEFNIGQNFLTGIAKKFVIDSQGAKFNPNNPYVYRTVGTNRLSTLNINMLEFFYEHMRRTPTAMPYDVVDGNPVYALSASHQLLARLYRDDSNLRQDVRFSGAANDNLTKYNFMSTIRGMFLAVPTLYPRRFVVVSNELVEVFPFVSGLPGEVGSFTDLNPEYELATHEEVLIHGRDPFTVFVKSTVNSIGAGTDFGPEPTFMNDWIWTNPPTPTDPFRRVGFFATSAELGLSAQFSEGVFGIVVERPSTALMAMYTPNPECPVAPPTCTNIVADMDCPCPVVLSVTPHPLTAGNYFVTFATPISGVAEDPIVFQLDNGATVTGELVTLGGDGLTAEVTFATALPENFAAAVVSVACSAQLFCFAKVVSVETCGLTSTTKLILENPLSITAPSAVTAFYGDGTSGSVTVSAIDNSTLTYTVSTGYLDCAKKGVISLCVPTANNASCPGCDVAGLTPCTDD